MFSNLCPRSRRNRGVERRTVAGIIVRNEYLLRALYLLCVTQRDLQRKPYESDFALNVLIYKEKTLCCSCEGNRGNQANDLRTRKRARVARGNR